MSDLLPLTGLWRNTSREGKTYWTGRLGGLRVMMFRNESTNPKAPEFNVVLGKYLSREELDELEAQKDPPGPDDEYPEIPF